jgi:hypothetical protein
VEWVKDNVLKQNCFVLFAGAGNPADQQWTFHHPIGETSLDASQWVATPTRDIGYLLQRRESEALASWKRQQELAKRRSVLAAKAGRMLDSTGQTEVWSFEGAPAIQPTIRSCMTAAKAAGASESEWLTYAEQAVRVAEQNFKEALRTQAIPADWLRDNPQPAHETKGGPLGTNPQCAIPYLNGLSTAAAKDKVIRVAIGLEQSEEPPSSDDEDEEEVTGEAKPHVTLPFRGSSPKSTSSEPTKSVAKNTVKPKDGK